MPDDWQSKFEVLNEQYEEFKSSSQELEQDLEAELAEAVEKFEKLENELRKLERELRGLLEQKEAKLTEANRMYDQQSTRVNVLESRKRELESKIQALEQDKDDLQRKQRALQADNEQQAEQLESAVEEAVVLREELEEREEEISHLEDTVIELRSMDDEAAGEGEAGGGKPMGLATGTGSPRTSLSRGRGETGSPGEKGSPFSRSGDGDEGKLAAVEAELKRARSQLERLGSEKGFLAKRVAELNLKNREIAQQLDKASTEAVNTSEAVRTMRQLSHRDTLNPVDENQGSSPSSSNSAAAAPSASSAEQGATRAASGSSMKGEDALLAKVKDLEEKQKDSEQLIKALKLKISAQLAVNSINNSKRISMSSQSGAQEETPGVRKFRASVSVLEQHRPRVASDMTVTVASPAASPTEGEQDLLGPSTEPTHRASVDKASTMPRSTIQQNSGSVSAGPRSQPRRFSWASKSATMSLRPSVLTSKILIGDTAVVGIEGLMLKRENKGAHWRERYVILNDEDKSLSYYIIIKGKKAKNKPPTKLGTLSLPGSLVTSFPDGAYDKPHAIGISPLYSKKLYILGANSKEDKKRWLTALEDCVDTQTVPNSLCEGYCFQKLLSSRNDPRRLSPNELEPDEQLKRHDTLRIQDNRGGGGRADLMLGYLVMSSNNIMVFGRAADRVPLQGVDLSGGAAVRLYTDGIVVVVSLRTRLRLVIQAFSDKTRDMWLIALAQCLSPELSQTQLDNRPDPESSVRLLVKLELTGKVTPIEAKLGSSVRQVKQVLLNQHFLSSRIREQYEDTPQCNVCAERFSRVSRDSGKRRRHCKNCGLCVCASCSQGKMVVQTMASEGETGTVRVCNLCYVAGEPSDNYVISSFSNALGVLAPTGDDDDDGDEQEEDKPTLALPSLQQMEVVKKESASSNEAVLCPSNNFLGSEYGFASLGLELGARVAIDTPYGVLLGKVRFVSTIDKLREKHAGPVAPETSQVKQSALVSLSSSMKKELNAVNKIQSLERRQWVGVELSEPLAEDDQRQNGAEGEDGAEGANGSAFQRKKSMSSSLNKKLKSVNQGKHRLKRLVEKSKAMARGILPLKGGNYKFDVQAAGANEESTAVTKRLISCEAGLAMLVRSDSVQILQQAPAVSFYDQAAKRRADKESKRISKELEKKFKKDSFKSSKTQTTEKSKSDTNSSRNLHSALAPAAPPVSLHLEWHGHMLRDEQLLSDFRLQPNSILHLTYTAPGSASRSGDFGSGIVGSGTRLRKNSTSKSKSVSVLSAAGGVDRGTADPSRAEPLTRTASNDSVPASSPASSGRSLAPVVMRSTADARGANSQAAAGVAGNPRMDRLKQLGSSGGSLERGGGEGAGGLQSVEGVGGANVADLQKELTKLKDLLREEKANSRRLRRALDSLGKKEAAESEKANAVVAKAAKEKEEVSETKTKKSIFNGGLFRSKSSRNMQPRVPKPKNN